jgi:hypothetical protein
MLRNSREVAGKKVEAVRVFLDLADGGHPSPFET